MTSFYDPISGEKRKLNFREKQPSPVAEKPYCEGKKWSHVFKYPDDETCKCSVCGASLLFVRALRNIDVPKKH